MSEHEAIEWRLQQLYQVAYIAIMVGLLTAMLACMIFAKIAGVLAFALVGLGLGLLGVVAGLYALAISKHGYARSGFERFIHKIDDPPLDEWADRLEANNSFPVDNNE
jgi:uncharacterized membrane protein